MDSLALANVQLQQKDGLSVNIMTRLKRNDTMLMDSLESICRAMNCGVDDILEFVPKEHRCAEKSMRDERLCK